MVVAVWFAHIRTMIFLVAMTVLIVMALAYYGFDLPGIALLIRLDLLAECGARKNI